MTDREVAEVMVLCRVLWPHSPVPDVPQELAVQAWAQLLRDVDRAAAVSAVEAFAASGERFAPPPGVIRRDAVKLVAVAGTAPTSEEAWAEVLFKIRKVGYTNSLDWCGRGCVGRLCDHHEVTFSHPAIQRTVDAFGWSYLCRSEDQMADRAHFVKFYASAVETALNRAAIPASVQALKHDVAAGVLGMGDG